MRYAKQIFIIFFISMIGEVLNIVLPLPVPAGVYGLLILLAALCSGTVKIGSVQDFGGFLLETMPMMFIQAAVGLLEQYAYIRGMIFPLSAVILLSTVIVMVASGKTAEFVIKLSRAWKKQ